MQLSRISLLVVSSALLSIQLGFVNVAFAASPSAPTNVVAERTSGSTVSIRWTPSSDDVRVDGYNVYRDDNYISTVTNPRLGDIQLAPDVIYTYYVIAFDNERNFSPRSATASTGGSSSVLPPVVNNDSGSGSPDGVVVNGNRISWPDDGWYQVQDASTFTEACAGTRFCDVSPGSYQVINHTTGQRFPNVQVSGGASSSPPVSSAPVAGASSVSVNGNRISLSDDGYYQVQDASTFAEQCSGTLFCDVSAGEYIVINHTNGVRTNVVVAGGNTSSGGVFISASNALERWADVVDVINEDRVDSFFVQLEQELGFFQRVFFSGSALDGIVSSDNIAVNPPYRLIEDSDTVFDVSVASVLTCVAGGRIVSYQSPVNSGGSGGDNVFENCAVAENEYRGTAGFRDFGRGVIGREPFVNFQRVAGNGTVQTIDGENFSGNGAFVGVVAMSGWRNLSFSDSSDGFSLSNYSIERESIDPGEVRLANEILNVDGNQIRVQDLEVSETINGQFTVRAPFTGGTPLRVTIDLAFQDDIRRSIDDPPIDFPGQDPELPFEWQTGEVVITANDGSSMRVLPVPGNAFMIRLGTGETLGPFPWTGQFELDLASVLVFTN